MKSVSRALVVALAVCARAAPAPNPTLEDRAARTTVTIPAGTLVGTSLLGVDNFAGIPFAEAPTGSRRLRPPVRLSGSLGTVDAAGFGPSCPQMFVSTEGELVLSLIGTLINTPFFQTVTGQTEDCLTMRVMRPTGTKAGAKLPVLFWIFGGGFEFGTPAMYDATGLLLNGIAQGKPFIFVAVNYRVGGFGFLAGKEVLADGASNLGLLDQRMGLEWTADNIAALGGDPDKVTIWGQSAGAISVLDQMALYGGDNTYKGKALFRAAIMSSGSLAPTEAVDSARAQKVYDTVVAEAGCSSAEDSLDCLRRLPYDKFLHAANSAPGIISYSSLALSYLPRPDGTILPASPEVLVRSGRYAAVPMIVGNQEDEGTLFSLFQPNISSEAELAEYLNDVFFHRASRQQMTALVATYDPSLAAGSPFRTGILNSPYPEFKRLAALLGDLVFSLVRRIFLNSAIAANPDVPAWSYISSYNYLTPILGTFHGSDLLQVFYGILPNYASAAIQTYYLSFLHTLDPNGDTGGLFPAWPQWRDGRRLMQFHAAGSNLVDDDFRSDSYAWMATHADALRV